MKKNEICPNCRSVYEIVGSIDLNAPSIQVVNCPVCNQGKWIPSGLVPYRWQVSKIITEQPVTTSPQIISDPTQTAPVWSTFDIPNYFKQAFDTVYTSASYFGVWSIVVLILTLMIMKEKK